MTLNQEQCAATLPGVARAEAQKLGQHLTLTIQAGEPVPEQAWMDAADYVRVLTPAGDLLQTLKALV